MARLVLCLALCLSASLGLQDAACAQTPGATPPSTAQSGQPALAVSGRIAGDEARARLVLEFDRKPSFSIHYAREPVRVIVDLPHVAFGIRPDDLVARGLVKDIRYGAMSDQLARLVITAGKPAGVAHAEVTPIEGGRYRLVVDVERVAGLTRARSAPIRRCWRKTSPWLSPRRWPSGWARFRASRQC